MSSSHSPGRGRVAVHDTGFGRHRRLGIPGPSPSPAIPRDATVSEYGAEVERGLQFHCNAVAGWLHLFSQVFSTAGRVKSSVKLVGSECGGVRDGCRCEAGAGVGLDSTDAAPHCQLTGGHLPRESRSSEEQLMVSDEGGRGSDGSRPTRIAFGTGRVRHIASADAFRTRSIDCPVRLPRCVWERWSWPSWSVPSGPASRGFSGP